MANIQVASLSDARAKLAAYGSRLKNISAKSEEAAERVTHLAVGLGGSAMAGALRAKVPTIPGTEIPSDAAAGAALAIGSVLGIFGKRADVAMVGGIGLMGPWIAEQVETRLS
jgi:hypothetical protein